MRSHKIWCKNISNSLRPKVGGLRPEAKSPAEGRKMKPEGRMSSHATGGGVRRQRRRGWRGRCDRLRSFIASKGFYWYFILVRVFQYFWRVLENGNHRRPQDFLFGEAKLKRARAKLPEAKGRLGTYHKIDKLGGFGLVFFEKG